MKEKLFYHKIRCEGGAWEDQDDKIYLEDEKENEKKEKHKEEGNEKVQ